MADYGFKVSEDGYDVKVAADANLSIKPGLDLIKMAAQGSISLSGGDNFIYHNLGYVPQYLAFAGTTDNTSFLITLETSAFETVFLSAVDDEKLIIYNPSPSYYTSAYYYIFYQQT